MAALLDMLDAPETPNHGNAHAASARRRLPQAFLSVFAKPRAGQARLLFWRGVLRLVSSKLLSGAVYKPCEGQKSQERGSHVTSPELLQHSAAHSAPLGAVLSL